MSSPVAANPQNLRSFPCSNCGAQLRFDADAQSMVCTHCQTVVVLPKTAEGVEEIQLKSTLATLTLPEKAPVKEYIYRCTRCGAEAAFPAEVATFTCAHCQNIVVNPDAYKTRTLQPAGLLPFQISKPEAVQCFAKWVSRSFWAPNDFRKLARQDALKGKYIPFWTFDAQTDSRWSGYAGTYVGSGKNRRVKWNHRQGTYDHFFNDVLVEASDELQQGECEAVFPFRMSEVVAFDPQYLAGWEATVCADDTDLATGYQRAAAIMKREIEKACTERLKDDTYKDLNVTTQTTRETFKHLLLPLWMCTYLYKNKTYHYLINGQTGKTAGRKPISWVKVTIAVLLVLFVLYLLEVLKK